jgi:uncharacterized protein YjbI with pentapeptide repeats
MLRRLGLLLAGFLVMASVLVLVFWALPVWLTRQPALGAADHYKAMADVRTGLAAILAALGGAGGVAYTARTFRLGQVGQLTGRFESAAKQMGQDDQTVRLAGIHAMAQLADEWVAQRQTCIDVLCAFVRVTSGPTRSSQPDDVREALRTTFRIIKEHLRQRKGQISWGQYEFDFTGAVLKEADFTGMTFTGGRFLFEKVQFEEGVLFDKAIFAGGYVSFRGAQLPQPDSHVSFVDASFRGGEVVFDEVTFGGGEAHFDDAVFGPRCLVTFKGTQLGAGGSVYFKDSKIQGPGICFTNSCFSSGNGEVRFDGATFTGTVYFDGAEFRRGVHFDGANLAGANLVFTGAKWHAGRISFDGADCTGMIMNLENSVEGWGEIDLRGTASGGTPRITGVDPVPHWVLLSPERPPLSDHSGEISI